MAGRIRTIKPEVLDDEVARDLSDTAWRLWVSSWVLADDHGRCRADARYLAANVWQDTSRVGDVEDALDELASSGLVRPYGDGGQVYAELKRCGWNRHQRIDKPSQPRVPVPTDSDYLASFPREPSRESPEGSQRKLPSRARTRALPPTSDLRPPTSDLRPPTPEGEIEIVGSQTGASAPSSPINQTCEYWQSRAYHPGKVQITKPRMARVKARLAEGYALEDLRDAIDGAGLDDWLMGRNSRTDGKAYRDLETILRDAAQVERLRDLWRKQQATPEPNPWVRPEGFPQGPPPPPPPPDPELQRQADELVASGVDLTKLDFQAMFAGGLRGSRRDP